MGMTFAPHNHRDWLKHLFAVRMFGKINLDPKNKTVAFSQRDICVLCEILMTSQQKPVPCVKALSLLMRSITALTHLRENIGCKQSVMPCTGNWALQRNTPTSSPLERCKFLPTATQSSFPTPLNWLNWYYLCLFPKMMFDLLELAVEEVWGSWWNHKWTYISGQKANLSNSVVQQGQSKRDNWLYVMCIWFVSVA